MTKAKYTQIYSRLNTKLVLEAIKERSTNEQLVKKFELHPKQINPWKNV